MSAVDKSKTASRSGKTPAASAGSTSRQTILDTAARFLRKEGYAATSLRAIADACDTKAGSLYYPCESKDQIVAELLDNRRAARVRCLQCRS